MDNDFQKMWKESYASQNIVKKASDGIKFVIGFPKGGGGSEIQSVLFDSGKWTAESASAWLKEHDFKNSGVDETENTLRFRQEDSGKYARMRTITFGTEKAEYDTYEGGVGGDNDSHSQPHKPFKPNQKTPATAKSIIDLSEIEEFKKTGGVPFKIMIEKAMLGDSQSEVVGDELPNRLIVEGLATTTNVDHDGERMAPEAVKAMEASINDRGVPLLSEHDKGWDSCLGKVFEARVDERNQLHIKAELDKDNSKAIDLYRILKRGRQLGLSIAGTVKRAALEMAEGLGKKVKTFYDVALNEVSVTSRPSNFDTWLIAKGNYKGKRSELLKNYIETDVYQEYLMANQSLDWRSAIAKSISEETLEVGLSKKSKTAQKNMTIKDIEKMAKNYAVKAIEEACKAMETKASETTSEEETDSTASTKEKAVETSETSTDSTTEAEKEMSSTDTETDSETTKETSSDGGETSSVDESSTKTAETSEYGPDSESSSEKEASAKKEPAKKAVPAKKESDTTETEDDESETTSEASDSSTESSTSGSSTSKSVKIDVDYTMDVLVKKFRDGMNDYFQKSGMRISGEVSDDIIKSFLETPKEKKGKAIIVTKNFNGEDENEEAKEEVEKDLKDKDVDFQSFFKKNFGSRVKE